MASKLCKDCGWFHADQKVAEEFGSQYGECHLHPPVFHHRAIRIGDDEYRFPIVDGNNADTCSDAKF